MFNKKSLIILCLTLHLTIGLKSSDFCSLKQQECKGFYDKQQNYEIKCNPIKCYGEFNYDCGLNTCSNNLDECSKFKIMNTIAFERQPMKLMLSGNHLREKNQVKLFNKQIKDCKNKVYEFDSNDFCENGRNCMTVIGYGHLKMGKQIDCKCPVNQSFRCEKYCTTDSSACDYFKSNEKSNHFSNIKDCGNSNAIDFRSYFSIL